MLILTVFPFSQVNTRTIDLLERLQCRERLADIHDKLNDWPSLIPSCLVVPRNRDPVLSCYNCELRSYVDLAHLCFVFN